MDDYKICLIVSGVLFMCITFAAVMLDSPNVLCWYIIPALMTGKYER